MRVRLQPAHRRFLRVCRSCLPMMQPREDEEASESPRGPPSGRARPRTPHLGMTRLTHLSPGFTPPA
jgi:hypothetical protein